MDSPESSRAAETSGRPSRGGSHVGSVARFELLRQFRRRRLLVLLIIVAVLLVLFIVVLQIFGSASSDAYAYASRFGGFVTILAALAATFFGADALLGEFEQRTGYLLFPQPVSRTSIFLGKLLAAFALTILTLAAYYVVVAAATGVAKGSVPIEIGYSFLLAVLYSTAALGVAFFLSSALRGTTMASILTFMLLFFVLAIASTILTVASIRPDGNLAFAGGTISNILSGPYPAAYPGDVQVPVGGPGGDRFRIYSPAVPISILVMAIWAAVGFGLAWALYRRREMKG
jgi:ABC-type transport system involved in multi-copper enzyme maturation permease subunit